MYIGKIIGVLLFLFFTCTILYCAVITHGYIRQKVYIIAFIINCLIVWYYLKTEKNNDYNLSSRETSK